MAAVRLLLAIVCSLAFVQCCFGADSFVVYQVNDKEPSAWAVFKDFFKEKGYDVTIYQAETTLERHVEKVPRINRSGVKFFLVMEMGYGEQSRVLVAMTDQGRPDDEPRGSAGSASGSAKASADWGSTSRFVAIDDLPTKHAGKSKRLAEAVAAPFKQKVKHVPLFPLLGVDMPGIFLRLEGNQDKLRESLGLLHGSIQSYLRRDVVHEK
jgi:hypothetical protein